MPQNRSPAREQLFRVGKVAVGFVVGTVGVVVYEIGIGLQGQIWVVTLIAGLLFGGSAVVAGAIVGTRVGQRIVGEDIEVAFREHGDTNWRHGRLSINSGRLTFQPYAFQMRIPGGDPTQMRVTRLGQDTGRRPPLRQIWSINPQLRIIDIDTDKGPKEVAALPSRLRELHDRLSNTATT